MIIRKGTRVLRRQIFKVGSALPTGLDPAIMNTGHTVRFGEWELADLEDDLDTEEGTVKEGDSIMVARLPTENGWTEYVASVES